MLFRNLHVNELTNKLSIFFIVCQSMHTKNSSTELFSNKFERVGLELRVIHSPSLIHSLPRAELNAPMVASIYVRSCLTPDGSIPSYRKKEMRNPPHPKFLASTQRNFSFGAGVLVNGEFRVAFAPCPGSR